MLVVYDIRLSNTVSDQLVGEEMFRANIILALARSSEPQIYLLVALSFNLGVGSPAMLTE